MSFTIADLAAEARRLWRAERALLLPVAGLFYFLPSLALLFLLPQPQPAADATGDAAGEALIAYATANAPAILSANLANIVGALIVLLLFLGRPRLTLGEALARAVPLLPAFLLAVLAMWALLFVGGLLVIPALYLVGRCFLVTSVVAGEGAQGPVRAIARSFALTKGRGWMLFGMAGLVFLTGQLIVMLAGSFDRALISGGMGSVLTFVVFNTAAALAATAASLAALLLKVAAYRRLAGGNSGI